MQSVVSVWAYQHPDVAGLSLTNKHLPLPFRTAARVTCVSASKAFLAVLLPKNSMTSATDCAKQDPGARTAM